MKRKILSVILFLAVLFVSVALPVQPAAQALTYGHGRALWTVDFSGADGTINSYDDPSCEWSKNVTASYDEDLPLDTQTVDCLKFVRADGGRGASQLVVKMHEQRYHVDYSTSLPKSNLVLEIKVYLKDLRFFTRADTEITGQIELSSYEEDAPDKQEWRVNIQSQTYKKGWNYIRIPLDKGTWDSDWVYGKLRRFRLYVNDPGISLGEEARTAYFDYVRLYWYPDVETQGQIQTTSTTPTLLGYKNGSAAAASGEYIIYAEEDTIFDPESPNDLLLADFREATVSENGSTLTGVRSIGSNRYYKNIDSSPSFSETVTASVSRGTVKSQTSTDAYNYLYRGETKGTATAMPLLSHQQFQSSGSTKYGWTVKLNFGGYVDLSRYKEIKFSFWMTDYHHTTINDSSSVVVGTPGVIQVNLQDSTSKHNEDGVNLNYNLKNARCDISNGYNAINNGHVFGYELYDWYYQNDGQTENTQIAAKLLKRTAYERTSSNDCYLVSPKYVDGLTIRFYVDSAETLITEAPTIYLGQVWASVDTDSFELSCSVDETDAALDTNQITYLQQKPNDYDPLTNWDGKQGNKVVTVADWYGKENVFVRGLVCGDYQYSTKNYSWPWRYDCGTGFAAWSYRTAFSRGGAYATEYTRKNEKWLTYTSKQVYGGTAETASGKKNG